MRDFLDYIMRGYSGQGTSRSVAFSNVIYISLPAVYLIFMLVDLGAYFRPLSEQSWDQFIVPVFIILCFLCLYLNYIGATLFSRLIFLFSWPMALHIVPVMAQQTPTDYYLAFPFGVVFHGVLIQMMISRHKHPVLFTVLILLNFSMLFFTRDFLVAFEDEQEGFLSALIDERYYSLDILLYWLLFNFIVYYILRVVKYDFDKIEKDKTLIEQKNLEILDAMEQLHKTQHQLIQREKLSSMGILAGGIAHEINNPLGRLYGQLDLIKRELNDPDDESAEQLKSLSQSFREDLDKVSRVTRSMILAAVDNDKLVKLDIDEILSNILYLVQLEEKEIKLKYHVDKPLIIECYASRLHRIIMAILENAIHVLKRNVNTPKMIKIEASRPGKNLELSISNNGEKIPEESLERIFDPFYTLEDTGEGIGLGLFVSYQLVAEMQGKIEVDQNREWVTFRLSIPISD